MGGFEHRYISLRSLLDEARTQVVGDADAPWGSRSELVCSDEAVIDPAKDRRRSDIEDLGGLLHANQFSQWRLRGRVEARNAPVSPQATDSIGSEAHAGGGGAPLPIENAGDDVIGVMDGEAANQSNGLLVGASRGSAARRQRHVELVEKATVPSQGEVRARLALLDRDDDLLDQGTQQLLAIAVGGRRRRPDAFEVGSQRHDGAALLDGRHGGLLSLTPRQLGFRGGDPLEGLLPLGFEAASDEAVVGV